MNIEARTIVKAIAAGVASATATTFSTVIINSIVGDGVKRMDTKVRFLYGIGGIVTGNMIARAANEYACSFVDDIYSFIDSARNISKEEDANDE